MDHRLWLVVALFFSHPAFAGYAQLAPPTGWSVTPAGLQVVKESAVTSAWRTAANNGVYASLNASLNLGGKAITVPAAARVAANASTFAARAAFGNPAVFAALAIGSAVYEYYNDEGFFIDGNGAAARWMKGQTGADAITWHKDSGSVGCSTKTTVPSMNGSLSTLAASVVVAANVGGCGTNVYFYDHATERAGTNGTVMDIWIYCTQCAAPQSYFYFPVSKVSESPAVPATENDFVSVMAPQPLPAEVINDWPQEVPLDIPLETPVINPKPITVPQAQPIPVPLPQPMTVPNGLPQPVVPATDPATWRQPVTEVQPANSPTSPWQVDLVPKDVITTDGKPVTEPGTDPGPTPNPSDEVEPTEPVDQPGLCDEYPDILACAKPQLGKVTAQPVNNQTKPMAINADTGWGPSSSACPAPKTAVVAGVSLQMPYTLLCDFATAIRPLLIAFAWLSAAVSFIGFGRKD